jgi:hypothetical protein
MKSSSAYYLLQLWLVVPPGDPKTCVHGFFFVSSRKPPDDQKPVTSPEPRGGAWPKSSALRGCVGVSLPKCNCTLDGIILVVGPIYLCNSIYKVQYSYLPPGELQTWRLPTDLTIG